MLTKKYIKNYLEKYCKGDYTKIEGFDRAMADTSSTKYHCHHRLELDLHLSKEELIAAGLYYNRQPAELLILTSKEHNQIHALANGKSIYATKEEYKKANLKQGKQRYKEHKDERLEQAKQYYKDHRAQVLGYSKQYYRDHLVEKTEYKKWWYDTHKTEHIEQKKQYYEANKEYFRRRSRVRHWIKAHPDSMDFPKTWNDEDINMFYTLNK